LIENQFNSNDLLRPAVCRYMMFARDHNLAVKTILTGSHVTTVCTQNNTESV